jgi:Aspartyl protease
LSRLIDKRFTGIATGVGQTKIMGKIHSAPLSFPKSTFLPAIEDSIISQNDNGLHLQCAFTVLDQEAPDMLLGLDMMRRFQAIIDLKNNCLTIHRISIPFLSEYETSHILPPAIQASKESEQSHSTEKEAEAAQLMKIVPGITLDQAREALSLANNNIDLAASILLGL